MEKLNDWGFKIRYSHIKNGIINESKIKLIKQLRIYNNLHCGNNSYYIDEQVDNLVPIEKPRPLALSKITLRLPTVSFESPKAPSKISSAIPLEKTLAEPLSHQKNTNTP